MDIFGYVGVKDIIWVSSFNVLLGLVQRFVRSCFWHGVGVCDGFLGFFYVCDLLVFALVVLCLFLVWVLWVFFFFLVVYG